jgi:hypothetical protein
MTTVDTSLLRDRILRAKEKIAVAERELEAALREIRSAPRADKTHVGETIERAFEKLRDAKQNVEDLEVLLGAGPTDP